MDRWCGLILYHLFLYFIWHVSCLVLHLMNTEQSVLKQFRYIFWLCIFMFFSKFAFKIPGIHQIWGQVAGERHLCADLPSDSGKRCSHSGSHMDNSEHHLYSKSPENQTINQSFTMLIIIRPVPMVTGNNLPLFKVSLNQTIIFGLIFKTILVVGCKVNERQ